MKFLPHPDILKSITLLPILISMNLNGQSLLYSNSDFQVYSDRVVQGKNEANILSSGHIRSNYQSPVNLFKPAELVFKFAINGRDNEMPPGVDHQFTVEIENGKAVTPVIEFGKKLTQISSEKRFMPTNAPVLIRLDFRGPLKELTEKGHFTTYNGQKIFKEDFKGVFPRFFTSASPVVADGLCIAALGGGDRGGVIAYDLKTGEEKWRWDGEGASYASPVLLTADGTKMVIAEMDKKYRGEE